MLDTQWCLSSTKTWIVRSVSMLTPALVNADNDYMILRNESYGVDTVQAYF